MCLGNRRKESRKKGGSSTHVGGNHQDYSQIFNELETQLIIHRALLMQRLVQDPFYRLMNVSAPARHWMLRHLAHLADRTEQRYRINLLQFFELMDREDVLKYFRYKNAPNEIIALWIQIHPLIDEEDEQPTPSASQ